MASINLTLAQRQNLLSLQTTSTLIGTTSQRLSTGLKVNSAIDNAPAFFAAASLSNRASDFSDVQSNADQTINALNVAAAGLSAISSLVSNLKGILVQASNATSTADSNVLVTQFNAILTQIDKLASDSSYQGNNLIAGNGTALAVNFNPNNTGTADFTVSAIRSDTVGLGLFSVNTNQFFQLTTSTSSRPSFASIASVSSISSVASFDSVASSPSLDSTGSNSSAASQASAASQDSTASNGTNSSAPSQSSRPSTASVQSIASRQSVSSFQSAPSTNSVQSIQSINSQQSVNSIASASGAVVNAVNTTLITSLTARVQSAISSLRTSQTTIGSNVTILQIRIDFTKNYTSELASGATKLTAADLNEEGVNLTTLQTKQQLGVTALSITNQSQQSILRLF